MLKRTLTMAALAFALAVDSSVQGADSSFTVSSTPPGAEVMLKGEATVVGITPTTFVHPLVGDYQVSIKKYGFERYQSRVTLDPTKPLSLDVRLVPKTRLKAAVRSLFIPGWGQKYTEQKTKSFLFNVLAAGSVAAFLLADEEFRYRRDQFRDVVSAYDNSTTSEQQKLLHVELVAKQQKAYDAESTRRATIGAVIGVWGLSVLDALFFFPSDYGTYSVGGIGVEPNQKPGLLGLQLSRRF